MDGCSTDDATTAAARLGIVWVGRSWRRANAAALLLGGVVCGRSMGANGEVNNGGCGGKGCSGGGRGNMSGE